MLPTDEELFQMLEGKIPTKLSDLEQDVDLGVQDYEDLENKPIITLNLDTDGNNFRPWLIEKTGIYKIESSVGAFSLLGINGSNEFDIDMMLSECYAFVQLFNLPGDFKLITVYLKTRRWDTCNQNLQINYEYAKKQKSWTTTILKYPNQTEVLTTSNEMEYTPTDDYHPTTKKYVDDKIPTKVSQLEQDLDFGTRNYEDLENKPIVTISLKENTDDNPYFRPWILEKSGIYKIQSPLKVFNLLGIEGAYEYVFNTFNSGCYAFINVFDPYEDGSKCVVLYLHGANLDMRDINVKVNYLYSKEEKTWITNVSNYPDPEDILTFYNSVEYTPTEDYHMATKKYVDDAINELNDTLKIVSFTLAKQSPQTAGTSVQLIVNAKGGTGELQYRFYRVGIGTTQVTVFRDWGTSNKTYCNPSAGKYIVYAEVRDTIGNIATTQTLFEWTAQANMQANEKISEDNVDDVIEENVEL